MWVCGGTFWEGRHAEIKAGLGNCVFAVILKKYEDENDADGPYIYFPIDFGFIFPNFRAIVKKIGAVWDFCGSSFYIGPSPLFFHVEWPYFSTWPYF